MIVDLEILVLIRIVSIVISILFFGVCYRKLRFKGFILLFVSQLIWLVAVLLIQTGIFVSFSLQYEIILTCVTVLITIGAFLIYNALISFQKEANNY